MDVTRLQIADPRGSLAAALLLMAWLVCPACSRGETDEEPNIEPVTQTPPRVEPLPQPSAIQVDAPAVASEGDCAPRYANGLIGTCINGQPCRGFGTRDDKGEAACSCFGLAGGCDPDFRCDPIKKRCVPETEAPFGRLPAK